MKIEPQQKPTEGSCTRFSFKFFSSRLNQVLSETYDAHCQRVSSKAFEKIKNGGLSEWRESVYAHRVHAEYAEECIHHVLGHEAKSVLFGKLSFEAKARAADQTPFLFANLLEDISLASFDDANKIRALFELLHALAKKYAKIANQQWVEKKEDNFHKTWHIVGFISESMVCLILNINKKGNETEAVKMVRQMIDDGVYTYHVSDNLNQKAYYEILSRVFSVSGKGLKREYAEHVSFYHNAFFVLDTLVQMRNSCHSDYWPNQTNLGIAPLHTFYKDKIHPHLTPDDRKALQKHIAEILPYTKSLSYDDSSLFSILKDLADK